MSASPCGVLRCDSRHRRAETSRMPASAEPPHGLPPRQAGLDAQEAGRDDRDGQQRVGGQDGGGGCRSLRLGPRLPPHPGGATRARWLCDCPAVSLGIITTFRAAGRAGQCSAVQCNGAAQCNGAVQCSSAVQQCSAAVQCSTAALQGSTALRRRRTTPRPRSALTCAGGGASSFSACG